MNRWPCPSAVELKFTITGVEASNQPYEYSLLCECTQLSGSSLPSWQSFCPSHFLSALRHYKMSTEFDSDNYNSKNDSDKNHNNNDDDDGGGGDDNKQEQKQQQ